MAGKELTGGGLVLGSRAGTGLMFMCDPLHQTVDLRLPVHQRLAVSHAG